MSVDNMDIFNRSAYDAAEKQAKSREARKSGKGPGPQRFWIPAQTNKHVIFLDDNPIELVEHQLTIDGDWKNWYVCCKRPDNNGYWTVGECPFCDMKIPKYLMGPYTVIDETGYTDRKGEVKKNIKCVLVAKERSLNKFKRLSGRHGGLRANRFECFRTDGKAVVIGDDWAFVDKVDDKLWETFDTKPVNYKEYFKVVSIEDANLILKSGNITIPERDNSPRQPNPNQTTPNKEAKSSDDVKVEY